MLCAFPCFLKPFSDMLEKLASPPLELTYVSPKPSPTLLVCVGGISLNMGTTHLQVTVTLGHEQHVQTKPPPMGLSSLTPTCSPALPDGGVPCVLLSPGSSCCVLCCPVLVTLLSLNSRINRPEVVVLGFLGLSE